MGTIVDKRDVIPTLNNAVLELGCGHRKVMAESVGIDIIDYPEVDVVGDVYEVLGRLPSASVRLVLSSHFLEHVPDLNRLMSELGRVVKQGGHMFLEVPHFSNPYFYSDPTHRTWFGLYTFSYLTKTDIFKRRVPSYGLEPCFELEGVTLGFRSDTYRLRSVIRRCIGTIVNSSRWSQECYEENLTGLISCYEIRFALRRL